MQQLDSEDGSRSGRVTDTERLAAIVESSDDAIFSEDLDGSITSWNRGAECMFGFTAQEMIGTSIMRLASEERQTEGERILAQIRRGERVQHFETVRLTKDGRHIDVSIGASPIKDSDGRVVGASKIVRDITTRRERDRDNLVREEKRRLAEQTVRHERDFSAAMLNSLPGVLYLYDQSGKFLRWNRNFEDVTGYSAAEVGAMHPLDFIDGPDRELVAERIGEVFAKGSSHVEAGFRSKDGRITPYYFTGVMTVLDDKACLVGVGIDLTERKRVEQERIESDARYRTLFEYAPDGILIADRDSTYLDANASICRMLGYERKELVGLHASDIVVPAEIEQISPALDEIRAKRDHKREWLFKRKDGSEFAAEVLATLMPDGHVLGMIRDISDRREAESALREMNETLEVKVTARTEELQNALVRAEAADRLKSAFLATMSHELRTPLNSIIGFTGILQQSLAGPITVEQSKQLGMVRSSARHLLELINDVLDISKIEAEQLELHHEQFDVGAALERVLSAIKPMVDKKGLTLTAEVSQAPTVMINDRRRFEQVLLNLLSNAVKFTDLGGVHLTVDIIDGVVSSDPKMTGKAIRLRVLDTGIGIRPEDLGSLFQPFRQIDTDLSRQREGTGLGLAICRRLATLLGGEISARSEPSKGSEFTVILPLPGVP